MRSGARVTVASVWALALGLVATGSGADTPAWRTVRGEVRVTCPLTVGGSFEARTTAISGSAAVASMRPPTLDGTFTVDLRTLATGIPLRDRHLKENYLEVGKGAAYETAVLSALSLGDEKAATGGGRTPFTGTLSIHGVERPVAGQADLRRDGALVHVTASFPVALSDYGIAKPQYLGVGVKNEVQVSVVLTAEPTAENAGAAR